MTRRRPLSGTGQPGRQEYGTSSRLTALTFEVKAGGPVGVSLWAGLGGGAVVAAWVGAWVGDATGSSALQAATAARIRAIRAAGRFI
ncbi:hypothetical protein GCM10022248_22390 [Nonomuraea soli]